MPKRALSKSLNLAAFNIFDRLEELLTNPRSPLRELADTFVLPPADIESAETALVDEVTQYFVRLKEEGRGRYSGRLPSSLDIVPDFVKCAEAVMKAYIEGTRSASSSSGDLSNLLEEIVNTVSSSDLWQRIVLIAARQSRFGGRRITKRHEASVFDFIEPPMPRLRDSIRTALRPAVALRIPYLKADRGFARTKRSEQPPQSDALTEPALANEATETHPPIAEKRKGRPRGIVCPPELLDRLNKHLDRPDVKVTRFLGDCNLGQRTLTRVRSSEPVSKATLSSIEDQLKAFQPHS